MARAYAAAATKVTAVVIAPTQTGKSKFIDELYFLQDQERPSSKGLLQVGNGKQSQTSYPKLMPAMPLRYMSVNGWKPKDADLLAKIGKLNTNPQKSVHMLGSDEKELLCTYRASWKRDPEYSANIELDRPVTVEADSGPLPVQIQLLDTPGLDDSFGRDDEHMENILNEMSLPEVESIIAFVFIVKNGQAYSDRFLRSVLRYWDQFPSFRQNWIFVHTAVDPSKTDYDDDSCFEQDVLERKDLLVTSLQRTCHDKEGIIPNLPQIFVDNKIPQDHHVKLDPTLQYGLELKKASRAEAYNDFFLTISANKPVPVKDLRYHKSEKMKKIDDILIGQFRAYKEGLLETLSVLEHQYTDFMGRYTKTVQLRSRSEAELRALTSEIDELDTEDLVLIEECPIERGWMHLGIDEEIEMASSFEIVHKMAACAADSQVKDRGVSSPQRAHVWKVRISSPAFTRFKAVLKTYTHKRNKHKKYIERKKLESSRVRERFEQHKHDQEELDADIRNKKDEMHVLSKRVELLTAEEASLMSKDVDLHTYNKLKDFYGTADGNDAALAERYFKAAGKVHMYPSFRSQL